MLTDEDRRTMAKLAVEKAENLLSTARQNLDIDLGTTVNRAYYAQFYAERALLISHGIDAMQFKSHQKTHGEMSRIFGENFPKGTVRAVEDLQAMRHLVDYSLVNISDEAAQKAIEKAQNFLILAKREIEKTLAE